MEFFVYLLYFFLLAFIVNKFVNGYRIINDSLTLTTFIYIIISVDRENFGFNNLWHILLVIWLLIFGISDILWGIRIIGLNIPFVNKLVLEYIEIKEKLFYWLKINLFEIRELVVLSVLIIFYFIQSFFGSPAINFYNYSLTSLLEFVIGIFSLYGIYFAFLQFLTENDKNYYLGVSKTRFILDNSLFSHLTRSKLFIINLILLVLIPVVSKVNLLSNISVGELEYLWQTCYIFTIFLYINLLKLNLDLIHRMFRFNLESKKRENKEQSKKDFNKNKWGLEGQISEVIQRNLTGEFWKIYRNQEKYRDDFIKIRLSEYFKLLNKDEYDDFLRTIFEREFWKDYNLPDTIFEYIKTIKEKNVRGFFVFYKKYCMNKWEFLRDYQDGISSQVWKDLIEQDIRIIEDIVVADKSHKTFEIEYPVEDERNFWEQSRSKKIREFLFDILLERDEIEYADVVKNIQDDLIELKTDSSEFTNYKQDFLEYKLKSLFKKFENCNEEDRKLVGVRLPTFSKPNDSNSFIDNKRNDWDNSMLYSQICFDYLKRGRLPDFNQIKVEQMDSEEEVKKKIWNQRIQNLILSMNEEYRLAFILYQLFYTDHIQWDDNLKFYDTEIKTLMNDNKKQNDYLFKCAKKIISGTNISHRITEDVLNKLWETRKDIIQDFSWFDHFGERHLMSDFKILYIQGLLSRGKNSYPESRISLDREFPMKINVTLLEKIKEKKMNKVSIGDFKWVLRQKKERLSYLCRDYLLFTDRLPTIFTKESYSYKQTNLQISVEYLLHRGKVNLTNVIENITISSLLRLEWMLRWNYYRYNQESNYTSRKFFDAMTSNSKYYWSGGTGILEFYIVKVIDDFYYDLYQEREFMDGFKYHLESQLNSLNKTVEEYLESIVKKISGIDNISILRKGQIISKLNDILFSQDKHIEAKARKNYRYRYRYR